MSEYGDEFDFDNTLSREETLVMLARSDQLQAVLQYVMKGKVNVTNRQTIQEIAKDPGAYLDSTLKQIYELYEFCEEDLLQAALNNLEGIYTANG
jgi:hypothetical protein